MPVAGSVPWSRVARAGAEIAVAVAVALLLVWLCQGINVDPIDRIGQVSGLAAVQLRYAVGAFALVFVVLVALVRLRGAAGDSVTRSVVIGLGCAVVAGLAGGAAAGGIVVALRGTPYGLNALGGDTGRVITWAQGVLDGKAPPATYPPLPVYLLAWLAKLTGQPVAYAMKTLQIIGVALIPPLAYSAWRMVLTPPWALVVGVTSAVPLIDAFKVYTNAVLVLLVPVLARALMAMRNAGRGGYWRAIVVGVVCGIALALLFYGYFGWFLWSLPGVAVAVLLCLPWRDRRGLLRAVVVLLAAVVVFAAICSPVLYTLFTKGSGEKDAYFYFDTYTRPTFFSKWFDDRPPVGLTLWPLPGGLGGVDVFTVLLFVGLGVALTLGYRRPDVLLLAALVGGAWYLRFRLAAQMYVTQSVQLYPRTSAEILYTLLVATGIAAMLAVRRISWGGAFLGLPLRLRTGAVAGLLAGTLLLFASMADAFSDYYMPKNDTGNGQLAYRAHVTFEIDGSCPQYTQASGFVCTYVAPTVTPNGTPILPQNAAPPKP